MVAAAETVEWIEVRNEVEALFLEYNLIKRHQPRFNIRLQGRQVVSVPRGHPRRGVAAGDGDARREAQGRPLLRPVRARLRDPRDARPAAADVPDPHVHARTSSTGTTGSGGRACTRTSRSARRRASATSTTRSTTALVARAARVPRRRHRAGPRPARQADARGRRRARVRAGGPAARPAALGAQGHRAPADGRGRRKRTSTSSALAEDPLEASVQVFSCGGAGSSAARGSSSTRWRTSTRRSSSAGCSSSSTPTTGRRRPREVLVPVEPEDVELYEEFLTMIRGARRCGSGCRSAAPSASCSRRCTRNAQEAFTQHKLKRASDHNARARTLARAPGGARPARGAVADRVLRHLEPPGHRDRRLDGRHGGRAAEAVRLPPLQGRATRRARTTSRRWRRCSPVGSAATSRSATRARRPASGSRTRRTCCSSTAARASSTSPCGCSKSSGSRTSRWPRSRSGSKRCTCPASPSRCGSRATPRRCFLLQQVRDEAHRFAITYHRQLREKRRSQSVLDDVPGLGPTRRTRLLREFGSVKKLRATGRRHARGDCLAARTAWPERSTLRLHALRAAASRPWKHEPRRGSTSRSSPGMSGAGRSSAADVLEDLGFFVIDNLPPALIPKVAELARWRDARRATRSSSTCAPARSSTTSSGALAELRDTGVRTRDPVPRRPTTRRSCAASRPTRAPHPLAGTGRVLDGITRERALLEELKGQADLVVDTTELNVHELRDRLVEHVRRRRPARRRSRSASCRSGTSTASRSTSTSSSTAASSPTRTGSSELRPLPGTDPKVRRYVLQQAETQAFLDELERLFALVLPAYVREGKAYLSIGVGCTGDAIAASCIAAEIAKTLNEPRVPRPRSSTGTSTVAEIGASGRAPAWSHSAAGTVWRSRCARSGSYAGTITAVVSVADDGGSSGRLRRDLGVVPPGDLRKCLVALAARRESVVRGVRVPLRRRRARRPRAGQPRARRLDRHARRPVGSARRSRPAPRRGRHGPARDDRACRAQGAGRSRFRCSRADAARQAGGVTLDRGPGRRRDAPAPDPPGRAGAG